MVEVNITRPLVILVVGIGAAAFGVWEITNSDVTAAVLWFGLSVVSFGIAAYEQEVLCRSPNDG